jgi:hypothetical protein
MPAPATNAGHARAFIAAMAFIAAIAIHLLSASQYCLSSGYAALCGGKLGGARPRANHRGALVTLVRLGRRRLLYGGLK